MTDLENGYAIVEGVYGNLIIYKDDKPFIPTNLEPMDETDEAWEKIGEIVDALNDDREAARAENKRLRKFEISAEVVRLAWLKDDTSLLDRALALLRDVAEQCTGHEVADEIINVVGDASGDDLDKFDILDIADKAWAGDDYGYTLLQSEKGGAA